MENASQYVIEMLHITKEFPGIKANDDITLQLKKGEIHALLGENGAGKSTLMSVLFGMYQPEEGEIRKNGTPVTIRDPNDATALGIGMVHQHFKLIDVFSVLDNIILGAEDTKLGFLQKKKARQKVSELSDRYGLRVDLDAKVEDITVGMQQRVEILKMLYRDNEILIFDEPTAVLTPQEIDELMQIMKNLTAEGKSILFISHKLNEIMAVSDRVTVLRKGKYVGTVETKDTDKQALSNMMVGRPVQLQVSKEPAQLGEVVLDVKGLRVPSKTHKKDAVQDISFQVHAGEIVCIAGIDGNGQSELIFGLTGLEKCSAGSINLCGEEISHSAIRKRLKHLSHIPEDRHKHGLVLDFTLEQNMVLQRFRETRFEKAGFLKKDAIREYANVLIEQYDVRSGQGPVTIARSMSGGNQQKAIIARELDRDKPLIIAVQPTRGLDVGATAARKSPISSSFQFSASMTPNKPISKSWACTCPAQSEMRKGEMQYENLAFQMEKNRFRPLHPSFHPLYSYWYDGRLCHSVDRGYHQQRPLYGKCVGRHPFDFRWLIQHGTNRGRYADLWL